MTNAWIICGPTRNCDTWFVAHERIFLDYETAVSVADCLNSARKINFVTVFDDDDDDNWEDISLHEYYKRMQEESIMYIEVLSAYTPIKMEI